MLKRLFITLALGFCISQVQAHQLAVTEVMTAEAGSTFPDWWELSNFGTNDVDLSGYSWNDDSHGGFTGADTVPFVGFTIHGGESIIVTEQKGTVTNAAGFRAWWGISTNVQVIVLNSADPGLGNTGDSVRVWSTNLLALGPATNGLDLDQAPDYLVDRVDTTAAVAGRSLYYNPTNGTFGISSTNGIDSAFVSATDNDVGSPGIASTNPAPIMIVNNPTNVLVNIGSPAVFSVTAYGLPKPRFQWLFNGQPVDTNTVTIVFTVTNNYCRSTLTVTNTQVTSAGTFRAVATNGFEAGVTSSNATLTVNTAPLAPFFTQVPPSNLSAYPGQTVTLSVNAFGNPPPQFIWLYNNSVIPDQSDAQYTFTLSDTNQTGVYTVLATNSAGGTNATLQINVTPKPLLRITEVQSSEATNADGTTSGHGDWWELSNLGTFPVNIQNYRFDDNSFSLAQSVTITNNVTIAPGESIVLCEDMTPDQFRTWWGATQLPPNLQIVDYHGAAVSFSSGGDALTVWNAVASTETDFIDSISISTATTGVTFGYDPYAPSFTGFIGFGPDGLSVFGVNGGIAAAVNGDIGSPGTIVNLPRITNFTTGNNGASLTWLSQSNYPYAVQVKTNLTDAQWTTVTNLTASSNALSWLDQSTNNARFYRVILNP